jgi:ribosomal protein S18 acetylase RimI-like enzyme
MAKAKELDPTALKRTSAGSYQTGDGRFTVEQASGRWMVVDAEQLDDLGLPLVRGPFDTLAEARAGVEAARTGPAPASDLANRRAARGRSNRDGSAPRRGPAAAKPDSQPPPAAASAAAKPLPVEVRRYEHGDGPAMRQLWRTLGFSSTGDDDESLDRLAVRNPGLVLVARQGDLVVATALGAWDGRRGWLYHVGVAADHRREGLGRRLVHEVERKLRQLGCPKVNLIVRDQDRDAGAFWEALGYASPKARQFGREI